VLADEATPGLQPAAASSSGGKTKYRPAPREQSRVRLAGIARRASPAIFNITCFRRNVKKKDDTFIVLCRKLPTSLLFYSFS
jgi:hypothetical protein